MFARKREREREKSYLVNQRADKHIIVIALLGRPTSNVLSERIELWSRAAAVRREEKEAAPQRLRCRRSLWGRTSAWAALHPLF
eukprot:gene12942-8798_t